MPSHVTYLVVNIESIFWKPSFDAPILWVICLVFGLGIEDMLVHLPVGEKSSLRLDDLHD